MKIRYIVELEPGVYLAPWLGDPPRTCVLVNSRWFLSKRSAAGAIVRARKYCPFLEARVLKVEFETRVLKLEVVDGIERIV